MSQLVYSSGLAWGVGVVWSQGPQRDLPPRGVGPDRQPPGRSMESDRRPPEGPRPPRPNRLLEALDADDDGLISAEEIKNASTALLELDRNGDGQLAPREFEAGPPPHDRRPDGPDGPPPGGEFGPRDDFGPPPRDGFGPPREAGPPPRDGRRPRGPEDGGRRDGPPRGSRPPVDRDSAGLDA
ncbi:MAG: hypothetical protein KDB14_14570 [Planctomycetales bacterium]|nr:hypothetical protein [Planctomycetales bacterium]